MGSNPLVDRIFLYNRIGYKAKQDVASKCCANFHKRLLVPVGRELDSMVSFPLKQNIFFLFFMNGLLLAYNRFLVDVWWKLNLLVLLILLGHSLQNFIHWSVCGKS